ncbi:MULTISPECIES: hypothetical protein [Salinibaculum]|uniref:hypothetical protein n=1 Tax=Salinibaculum TaxID=2732368 RepID=UPI0030D515CF
MKRRTLLGGLGAALGTGLAGCTGFGAADADAPTDDTETPSDSRGSTPERTDDTPVDTGTPSERPVTVHETLTVPGEAGGASADVRPHHLRLYNDVDTDRAVTFSVSPSGNGVLRSVSGSYEVPARHAVSIELQQPATYSVAVSVDGDLVTTFELDESWFDCNSSATLVRLGPDGTVERTERSTLLACTDATVEGPETDGK